MIVARRTWVEPGIIVLLAPLLLFPGRFISLEWHPYGVILAFLFATLAHFLYQRNWVCTPLNGAITVLLLWLPVNYWASIDKPQSWEALGYLLFGIVSWRTLLQWNLIQQAPQRLAYLFLFVGVGLTLLGPLLLAADPSFAPLPLRFQLPSLTQGAVLFAETVNPNVLAGAFVLLLPFYTAFIFQRHQLLYRWLRGMLMILWPITVGILFITQSRGALLAAGLAVLIVLSLCYAKVIWLMPVFLIMLIGATLWIGPRPLLDTLVASSAFGGMDGRIEIWNRALYAFHDFPFTGIGIGTFNKVIPLLYPYFLWTPEQEIPHAHNLILQVGVDLGLIGLIAQVALWINLFWMLRTLLRCQTDDNRRVVAVGAFGSLIAMLLHGLVDAVTWGNKLAFLPWWLYALITLLFLQHWEEEQKPTSHTDFSNHAVSIPLNEAQAPPLSLVLENAATSSAR